MTLTQPLPQALTPTLTLTDFRRKVENSRRPLHVARMRVDCDFDTWVLGDRGTVPRLGRIYP